MKNWILSGGVALMLGVAGLSTNARAEGDAATEVDTVDTATESPELQPRWEATVKSRYGFTDAQMQKMREQGLKGPQMAMTGALVQSSGKSLDEVMKMRTEQKMGWGKIAKTLGVEPKALGQSVRDTRHEVRDDRREAREKRRDAREDAREKRQDAREERKEARREAREKRRDERRDAREERKSKSH